MHYSPLSTTDIFPQDEDTFVKRQCIACHGKQMYVEQKENGEYELLQLLSTDPEDFMDSRFTPGNLFP